MAPSVMLALTLVHLLISCAFVQTDSTTQDSCSASQLLIVNGCPIFVHDVSGAMDFEVEPLMCITQNLGNLHVLTDPLTQQLFVSVPVTVRDDSMLVEINNQLQHLSPKSLEFAAVSKISFSMDASSKYVQTLMFLWSPDEPVAYLRLGCPKDQINCGQFFLNLKDSIFDAINWVAATATIKIESKPTDFNYKLMVQNQSFYNPQFYGSNFECRKNCDNLQFFRTIHAGKCIARVYRTQDGTNLFYIEPLLCPNSGVTNGLMMYDYSREMHYVKLDVLLQDDVTLNAVRSRLARLSPANVSFMQLWQVKIVLSSLLSSRFDIGPLMVSGDWRSGQMRVYCKTEDDCKFLRSNVIANPHNFWSHVHFEVTSQIPSKCVAKSTRYFYNIRLTDVSNFQLLNTKQKIMLRLNLGQYQSKTVDGREFVIIQQRMSNSTSFARSWNEYEVGFGDATNFWIGLSKIHSLSINGVTLRVEIKLMDDRSEQHQEYAGFKVGDASTNYTMTCGGVVVSRSSNSFDTMAHSNGMQFSTMDRDNDGYSKSCSLAFGKGGWWYNSCSHGNPNNVYGDSSMWYLERILYQPLREIRLMLEI